MILLGHRMGTLASPVRGRGEVEKDEEGIKKRKWRRRRKGYKGRGSGEKENKMGEKERKGCVKEVERKDAKIMKKRGSGEE